MLVYSTRLFKEEAGPDSLSFSVLSYRWTSLTKLPSHSQVGTDLGKSREEWRKRFFLLLNQHLQNTGLTLHTSEQLHTSEWSTLWPPCWGWGLWAWLWHTSRYAPAGRWEWFARCANSNIFWPDLFERLSSISCLLPPTLQWLWDCRQSWHYKAINEYPGLLKLN